MEVIKQMRLQLNDVSKINMVLNIKIDGLNETIAKSLITIQEKDEKIEV